MSKQGWEHRRESHSRSILCGLNPSARIADIAEVGWQQSAQAFARKTAPTAWKSAFERGVPPAPLAAPARTAAVLALVARPVARHDRPHSVHPQVMSAHLELYRELMFGQSELSRIDREVIAVAVSSINDCHY
jgi:hypothetical protein